MSRPARGVFVCVVACFVIAGLPSIARTGAIASTSSAKPSPPQMIVDQARVVGVRDTPIGLVRLWEAPTTAGGLCTFLQVPDLSSAAAEPVANGGSVCELGRHRPQRVPIVTSLTWIAGADGFAVLLEGRVASWISRLELVSGAARTALSLERGYFLGSLASNADAQLQREGAPYALVGYSARGSEVARFDLLDLVAHATPPSTRHFRTMPTERSRTLATCTPDASVPEVNNHQGYAWGLIWCDSGAPSYYYLISLRNRAGNSLITREGYFTGFSNVSTPTVTCTGAYVHSFLYINVGGAGKSDSSEEYGLC